MSGHMKGGSPYHQQHLEILDAGVASFGSRSNIIILGDHATTCHCAVVGISRGSCMVCAQNLPLAKLLHLVKMASRVAPPTLSK